MMELLSPKRVAYSIGVSESSLKRWCDQGLIRSSKTPGGHRRLAVGDVVHFLRETNRPLAHPDAIGLPAGIGSGSTAGRDATNQLHESLIQGREADCRRLVLDRYLSGEPAASLCEELVAPAMREIGDLWTCGSLEVFQERRACEIVGHLIHELRNIMPTPAPSAPIALGGAPSGDNYQLATKMVELTLREAGWNARSLGSDLPYSTLVAAAKSDLPRLLWLSLTSSVGSDTSSADLQKNLQDFRASLPEETGLVVGGQAVAQLDKTTLQKVRVCKTLADLTAYAEALLG